MTRKHYSNKTRAQRNGGSHGIRGRGYNCLVKGMAAFIAFLNNAI